MIAELLGQRRRELSRLRALSVKVTELSAAASREAFGRFAAQFVASEKAQQLVLTMEELPSVFREVDYGRWLRADARSVVAEPGMRWLSRGRRGAVCVRFDRWAGLPGVRIGLDRMRDEWALSWPGVFVSFEARRALSVSIDYEVTCCDLSALGGSPYR
jgi:hypothetical protein